MLAVDPAYFKSDVPEGESGSWIVERFTVDASEGYDPDQDDRPDFAKRRPGSYTRLRHAQTVFMTDRYDEWWTQKTAIREACRRGGWVLITGLGLGLVVESMLRAPDSRVDGVTVVERSPDVLRLVGPHLAGRYGDRLELVEADAFRWRPPSGRRFSLGWHDIWPNPLADEVDAEMERLETRYQRVCDWQGSWPRDYRAEFGIEPASAG